MKVKRYDQGGVSVGAPSDSGDDQGIAAAAREINEAFPRGMPNYLSSTYTPARSVGTGVAVQNNALRDLTNAGGVETITLNSRNAPRNAPPAALAGADLENALYTLTGGRAPISGGQFFQPVYRPEPYYNYRETPSRTTVGPSPLGFNPSDFVSFGPARDLRANLPSGFANFTPAEKINYFNQIGATPQEIMRGDPTLTQEGLDWMRSQGYRGGVGSSVPRMFGPVAQPYTPTASFDTYSGYNPFALGAVNPYASRMQQARPVGRGVSVQQPPRSPFRSFLSRPLAAGGRIEDGIRSVRYR